MSILKTIKPDGTGDFTTLQAWWNWAQTQTTPDHYIAECYGNGNLGSLDMASPSFTPDATNYFEIRNAANENPYIVVTDGFCIRVTSVDYTQIKGIKCTTQTKTSFRACLMTESVNNLLIERCWFEYETITDMTRPHVCRLYFDGNGEVTFRNNVIFCPLVAGYEAYDGVIFWNSDSAGNGGNVYVHNNTSFAPGSGIYWYGGTYSTNRINVDSKNNAVFFTDGQDNGSNNFREYNAGFTHSIWTITQEYCCSQDDTADDWGGTGNLINKTIANSFEDYANKDFRPKLQGELYDTGITIAGITEDYEGNPRPYGKEFDIGAYERTLGQISAPQYQYFPDSWYCEHPPPPVHMISVLTSVLRMHFSNPDYILIEPLKRFIWSEDSESPIMIGPAPMYNPEEAGKRPAILVNRSDIAMKPHSLDHGYVGNNLYALQTSGNVIIDIRNFEAFTTELLAYEVRNFLWAFLKHVEEDFILHWLRLESMSALRQINEPVRHWQILITCSFLITEGTEVKRITAPIRDFHVKFKIQ